MMLRICVQKTALESFIIAARSIADIFDKVYTIIYNKMDYFMISVLMSRNENTYMKIEYIPYSAFKIGYLKDLTLSCIVSYSSNFGKYFEIMCLLKRSYISSDINLKKKVNIN